MYEKVSLHLRYTSRQHLSAFPARRMVLQKIKISLDKKSDIWRLVGDGRVYIKPPRRARLPPRPAGFFFGQK